MRNKISTVVYVCILCLDMYKGFQKKSLHARMRNPKTT